MFLLIVWVSDANDAAFIDSVKDLILALALLVIVLKRSAPLTKRWSRWRKKISKWFSR